MINTFRIPQHTGNFEELEKAASGLRTDAAGIRRNGSDVHSRFQMLAGVYVAPEAEDLFRTTQPVMDKSEVFATKLETVADALDTFAIEASPLADRLKVLKADGEAFFLSVADDEDWQDDDTKRDRHNALDARIRQTVDAFQEAERRAANKIAALVGDVRFVGATGSDTVLRGMHDITYGIAPGEIKDASKLPWGEPIAESHDWNDFGYWSKSFFWDGLVVDNIWGSLKGLGALATGDSEAWKGLASVASGVSAWVSEPYDELMDVTMGEDGEKDDDRNKKALKEFGKALVGWDMWDENPARAASTVVFNGLTLGAGPLASAGRVGRGGALSKGATVAGNVGKYLDPLTAGLAGTAKVSQALPRLAELTHSLRSTNVLGETPNTHTLIELGNSRVRVDGEFTVIDRHGRAITHDVPEELSAGQRTSPERIPAGVAAHDNAAASGATHTGGGIPSPDRTGPGMQHDGTQRAPRDSAGQGERAGNPTGTTAPSSAAPSSGSSGHSGTPPDPSAGHSGDAPRVGPSGHGSAIDSAGSDGLVQPDAPYLPEVPPSRYRLDLDDIAPEPHGPMSPADEARVSDELTKMKMPAHDQAALLGTLRKDPHGAAVAELISRGHLRNAEGYRGILDMCKQGATKKNPRGSMVPAARMALDLATELQARGHSRVGFEFGDQTTPWDLDVYTRRADGGIDYGYQLKNVQSAKKIVDNARGAVGQLMFDGMRQRVAILNIAHSKSTLTAKSLSRIEEIARKSDATILLRFQDGAVQVPPNGNIYP